MKNSIIVGSILGLFVSSGAIAATYELEGAHSAVGFKVKHMGISTVPGKFNTYKGTIAYDKAKPEATKINVEIETASIDTGTAKRDDHLKSKDFFEVTKFPKMTFVSKTVKANGATGLTVVGDLTLHGVTKPVTLEVTDLAGPGLNPGDKKNHVGASVAGTIKRQDFGLTWNGGGMTGLAGEQAIADNVKLEFDIDAVEAAAAKK